MMTFTAASQDCIRKSFRQIIQSDVAIQASEQIVATDGSRLVLGKIPASGVGGDKGLVIKLDENGAVVWSQEFGSKTAGTSIAFHKVIVTRDGNFLVAGYSINATNSLLHFISIEKDGSLRWQKAVGLPSLFKADAIDLTALAEGHDGEWLLTASIKEGNQNTHHALLLKGDADGNIMYNKMVQRAAGVLDAFIGLHVEKDHLTVFGFLDDGLCQDADPRAVYALQVDYTSGDLKGYRRHCFSPDSRVRSYSWSPYNFKVTKVWESFFVYGHLAEGNAQKDIAIMEFDARFGFVQGGSIGHQLPGSFSRQINMGPEGDITFLNHGDREEILYYSTLHWETKKLRQRALAVYRSNGLDGMGGQRIAHHAGATSFVLNENKEGKSILEIVQDDWSASTGLACMGADTSISTLQDFWVYPSDVSSPALQDLNLVTAISDLEMEGRVLHSQILCSQEWVCDSLKIEGKDSVYVVGQEMEYMARTTAGCKKKLPGISIAVHTGV